jgi:hypothetical protein
LLFGGLFFHHLKREEREGGVERNEYRQNIKESYALDKVLDDNGEEKSGEDDVRRATLWVLMLRPFRIKFLEK